MALLERREGEAGVVRAEDRFVRVGEDEALPATGAVLVSLPRFEAERDALLARTGALGVWLASDESPVALEKDLDRLALVACDFPAFSDGRAFSYARLLRERYGYSGEIRAIGEVYLEQLPFMVRSGFSAFDLKDEDDPAEIERVCAEVRTVYQPTGDGRVTALQRRLGR